MTEFEKIDRILLSQTKIIHQIWFDFRQEKDKKGPPEIPDKYKNYRESWATNNPDWLCVLWDDDMSNQMVKSHFPELWKVYSKYPTGVQRCDAFRYCLLYRYGGFYVDVDTKCLKPVNTVFDDRQLAKDKPIILFENSNSPFFYRLRNGNFAMYSIPKQDFWQKVIKDVIKSGTWTKFVPFSLNVINSTGPGQLSHAILKYKPNLEMISEKYFPARKFGFGISEDNIPKEAIAIHFSDVSWRPSNVFYQEGAMMVLIILIALVLISMLIYFMIKYLFRYN
jgi:mannosyltransferase OCH1-like enzyme